VAAPGTLNLLAVVGAFARLAWQQNVASFFDGKGQPSQVSAVSHGRATTRFNKVNVLNTARKI
jgi:hypothetical protein